jgi:hypothetical protein
MTPNNSEVDRPDLLDAAAVAAARNNRRQARREYGTPHEDGDPFNPPALVTPVANWEVGEVVMLGPDEQVRIVEIDTEMDRQLLSLGFNAIFYVEPI